MNWPIQRAKVDPARRRAEAALRRSDFTWWCVYGPVRTGTTLMVNLIAKHARWSVSDWGLSAALTPPMSATPPAFDVMRVRRALLGEVLASCETGSDGPLDLVYKQANLRRAEFQALVDTIGPPQRTIFCLREPAGFIASARKKFPDADLDELRTFNYIGTIEEHAIIGGDVFVYGPDKTATDYAEFLHPLKISAVDQATISYAGTTAPELVTDAMKLAFESITALG